MSSLQGFQRRLQETVHRQGFLELRLIETVELAEATRRSTRAPQEQEGRVHSCDKRTSEAPAARSSEYEDDLSAPREFRR